MKKNILILLSLFIVSSINVAFAKKPKATPCTSNANCTNGQICAGETGKMTCGNPADPN